MGELLTFTPRPGRAPAIVGGLPATIVIFPGVRYDRAAAPKDAVPVLQRHGAEAPEKAKS